MSRFLIEASIEQAARRRSVIVFQRTNIGIEKQIFVSFFDDVWEQVKEHLESGNGDIAVNKSEDYAFADGISAGELQVFKRHMSAEVRTRIRSPELLPIYFLMLRPPGQLLHYARAVELSHSIIVRAMSNEVIQPGVTTCADVSWWMWQTAVDYGFECWFQPSFGVQRAGRSGVGIYEGTLDGGTVIERGDFLWTDYGINYAGMHTDMQHMGYVLHEGEGAAPQGLQDGMKASNRMQDLILEEMKPGCTGNEVLAAFTARMEAEGIDGTMSVRNGHPAGYGVSMCGPGALASLRLQVLTPNWRPRTRRRSDHWAGRHVEPTHQTPRRKREWRLALRDVVCGGAVLPVPRPGVGRAESAVPPGRERCGGQARESLCVPPTGRVPSRSLIGEKVSGGGGDGGGVRWAMSQLEACAEMGKSARAGEKHQIYLGDLIEFERGLRVLLATQSSWFHIGPTAVSLDIRRV
eukprot:SAG11_NODE_1993_length_3953_cov_3.205501_3_plen_464_part_00